MKRGIDVLAGGTILMMLFSGCSVTKHSSPSPAQEQGQLYWLTTVVVDGMPAQVIKSRTGLGIVPRPETVTILFETNGLLVVDFDKNTLKPLSISLQLPSQMTFDINADGMPDMRELNGEAMQLYYQGQWYDFIEAGENNIIKFDGRDLCLHFDKKKGWHVVTEPPKLPPKNPKHDRRATAAREYF